MVSPVKDPELLALLEGESTPQAPNMAQPVRDPELLAILNQPTEQAPAVEPERAGLMDELGRQLGLTGRAIAGGAAQAVEPFTEPLRYLMNKALPGNPVGNIEDATDAALTSMGVPEPQGPVERGVQTAGRFVTSAGTGLGLERAVEKGVGTALGGLRWPKEAPSYEQLKELGNAAYKAADDAGLVVHPGSFKNFVGRIDGITRQAGIDRDIHPRAFAAVRRMKEAVESGQPMPLQEIDILRKVTQAASGSADKAERKMGQLIKSELDDYINRLGDSDILSGDGRAAAEALNLARNAWTRLSKSETIQEAVQKAGIRAGQFSGSGFENALRTQFRQIAMSNKRMRGFSPEEQDAIKKVASGGPVGNAFRYLGKLAPTGVVSGSLGAGAGYAIGGAPGAIGIPLAGAIARRIATKGTIKNAENLDEMVRRGMPNPKEAPEWLLPWLSGGIFGVDTQGN